jgi:hypothetical protein
LSGDAPKAVNDILHGEVSPARLGAPPARMRRGRIRTCPEA